MCNVLVAALSKAPNSKEECSCNVQLFVAHNGVLVFWIHRSSYTFCQRDRYIRNTVNALLTHFESNTRTDHESMDSQLSPRRAHILYLCLILMLNFSNWVTHLLFKLDMNEKRLSKSSLNLPGAADPHYHPDPKIIRHKTTAYDKCKKRQVLFCILYCRRVRIHKI